MVNNNLFIFLAVAAVIIIIGLVLVLITLESIILKINAGVGFIGALLFMGLDLSSSEIRGILNNYYKNNKGHPPRVG